MKTHQRISALLLACGCAVLFFSVHNVYGQKIAQESGDWPGIEWSPAGDPGLGEQVNIGNEFSVNYIGVDLTRVGRLHIGSGEGGFTPNGTLTVSSGTLQTSSTGSLAMQVGFSENSNAVLNINGGNLNPDGGWVTVGTGLNSSGTINLSSGSVDIPAGNLSLGSSDGSTGTMNMTGGSLNVSGTLFLGRTNTNNNHGVYNQSGGIAVVNGPMRIGNATAAGHLPTGAMSLSGGITAFGDNITIGNTTSGVLGEGSLSVGPMASLVSTGNASTILLGGNAELEFVLGSTLVFNPIDLTSNTTSTALSFLADSLITVDASNLLLGEFGSIDLITFVSGRGPTLASLDNIQYALTGFEPGMSGSLSWTSTSLVLTVVPEPGAAALFLGFIAMGWIVFARRRCATARN